MGRRDCAVVEKTKAAGQVAIGVMTRRTAECVSRVLAVHHELSRRCRHIGSRARGSPGAGADRTGRIDRMPAETADNVGRYVAALRTGCMLAIISGPESPSAVQASHASARKPRYSGLWTLARGPCPKALGSTRS